MNVDSVFIINSDVKIIPVTAVKERIQESLLNKTTEVILSRPSSRAGSITLDSYGKQLFDLFSNGESLPKALKALAQATSSPVQELARLAYPLIQNLINSEYLVPKDAPSPETNSKKTNNTLNPGDSFRDTKILELVQHLDDTDVYKVALSNGNIAALKLVKRPTPRLNQAFLREAMILKELGSGLAPELIESGEEDGAAFILLEWINGYSINELAARFRSLPREEKYNSLKALTLKLLKTYQLIHQKGIFHSDIYPKNVFVDQTQNIKILDFGTSWFRPAHELYGAPRRVNNNYFRAPDLAAAEIAGITAPPPSVASEIYSLGALIYMMVAGAPYANFSLELIEQRKQVCEIPMTSFADRGLESWPEMESLLRRMLEKDSTQRISSLEECITILKQVRIPTHKLKSKSLNLSDSIPFLRSFIGQSLQTKLPSPYASLWWGAGGLGYAFLRGSMFLNEPSLLREAQYFSRLSKKWASEGEEGFFSEAVDTTAEGVGPNSIMHRSEGLYLLEAIIAHSVGDSVTLARTVQNFLSGTHKLESRLEYCCGKAGLLNAIEQMTYLTTDNLDLIKVGEELSEVMMAEIRSVKSLKKSHIQYAGFAHGWAGIFYSLISWARNYKPQLVLELTPFLNELAMLKTQTPAGIHWPLRFDKPLREGDLASWCNGTAGFVLLWIEVYKATNDEKWLQLALEAGQITAAHHDRYSSLCCGAAGRSFALVSLYQETKDKSWLVKSEWCLGRARTAANPHIHSLYKGIPGLELARLELKNPDLMSFPLLATKNYGPPLRTNFE
jgi:serine/threonine-protein kinase